MSKQRNNNHDIPEFIQQYAHQFWQKRQGEARENNLGGSCNEN